MVKVAKDFAAVAALYARKYSGKTILVKFGGEIASDDAALSDLMKEAITLRNFGANIILLHGGGPQITERLKEANLFEDKIDGVRPTSSAALDITHNCLADLNRQIVNRLHQVAADLGADVRAVGLGCNDGGLIIARSHSRIPNGRTGEVASVNTGYLEGVLTSGMIAVLHPICLGADGQNFNVNADDAASALGQGLGVERLIFISDTYVYDANKKRIDRIQIDEVEALISSGIIQGGMAAKIRAAASVVQSGVGGVVILDGKDSTALQREILTDEGAGTLVVSSPKTAAPSAGLTVQP